MHKVIDLLCECVKKPDTYSFMQFVKHW